ncbi:MAG: IS66 family transposase [Solirubrobacteraceae bacterium]
MVAVAASEVEVLDAEPVDELAGLLARCSALSGENEHLWAELIRVVGENERLFAKVEKLEGLLEETRRAGKRQAAPFSRGKGKENPGRPGRKAGDGYGRKAHRQAPERFDEEYEAPTPDRCECGGTIEQVDVVYQFQEELPVVVAIRRRFRVYRGRCGCCGKRHQGRHPYQGSDALGAAGAMLGPRAVALATQLNKELGLSPQKTAKALLQFGIKITPGGVVGAVARQARRLEPTYGALVKAVRASPTVAPDETGWRINAQKRWLWAFVGDLVTVYAIGSRGYDDAERVLGEDFSGVLERDGWQAYRGFGHARHQTCLNHLLKRCRELIEESVAGQAEIPHAVRTLLKDALGVRDRYAWLLYGERELPVSVLAALSGEVIEGEAACQEPIDVSVGARAPLALPPAGGTCAGEIIASEPVADQPTTSRPGCDATPEPAAGQRPLLPASRPDTVDAVHAARALAAERSKLEARLDRLVELTATHDPNRKLLAHLKREREHTFMFLKIPGVQATNWRAEQAIRPAVVNRKNWGGNKTSQGARTQEVTISVIRTARQQQLDPIELMAEAHRQRTPTVPAQLRLPTARSDPPLAA